MAENENKQENVVVEDFKRTNAKKSKKKFRHRQQNARSAPLSQS